MDAELLEARRAGMIEAAKICEANAKIAADTADCHDPATKDGGPAWQMWRDRKAAHERDAQHIRSAALKLERRVFG
jgi:hypothetical protein